MSASLEMHFQMTKGSDEEFQAVLKTLRRMGGSEKETWWGLNEKYHSFTIGNSDFPAIWGKDFLGTDPEPYVMFAKAAPNAEWTASSERCYEVDGTESSDKASYADGILDYRFTYPGSSQEMDYYDLCEYVGVEEESDYDFDEEEGSCDDELTLEKLRDCFPVVTEEVEELFENRRKLKKAEFLVDEYSVSLFKKEEPLKLRYVIKEYFLDGKEPESLEGKTFVITGELKYFDKRDAMIDYIEKKGGRVTGSVSKKTDCFVCNDPAAAPAQMKKAAEFSVPVLTESEFIGRFGFPGEYDDENV